MHGCSSMSASKPVMFGLVYLEWLALHQLQTHLWSVLPVPDHSVPTLGLLAISELIVTNLLVIKIVLSRSSSLAMDEQHILTSQRYFYRQEIFSPFKCIVSMKCINWLIYFDTVPI